MDRFTITAALKSYATTKGWKILMGDRYHQNAQASRETYSIGTIVIGIFPFTTVVPRAKAAFGEITYRSVILLGRKFETLTHANLDETYAQKYDNRLKDLIPLLANSVKEFACSNELEYSGEIADEIDNFDTDIDFVGGLFTFYQ